MAISTCVITGTVLDSSGTAIEGALVKANLVMPFVDSNENLLLQREVQTTTNSLGVFTLTLIQGSSGIVAIEFPPNSMDSNQRYAFSIIVPAASTATFTSLTTEL